MLSSPTVLLKRAEHTLLTSVFCVGNMFPVNVSLNAPNLCTSPITQKQLKEETNLLNEGNNEMKEPPNRSSEDPKCQPLMTLKVTKFIHNVLQGSACVLKGQLELFSAGRGDQLVVHSTLLMTMVWGRGSAVTADSQEPSTRTTQWWRWFKPWPLSELTHAISGCDVGFHVNSGIVERTWVQFALFCFVLSAERALFQCAIYLIVFGSSINRLKFTNPLRALLVRRLLLLLLLLSLSSSSSSS